MSLSLDFHGSLSETGVIVDPSLTVSGLREVANAFAKATRV